MKEFEIWIEGFYAQGMFVEPRCIALHVEGETFRKACYNLFDMEDIDTSNFNREVLSFRGHSLFYKEPKS